jgi:hypothetical protein
MEKQMIGAEGPAKIRCGRQSGKFQGQLSNTPTMPTVHGGDLKPWLNVRGLAWGWRAGAYFLN